MKKRMAIIALAALLGVLLATPTWADSYTFKLSTEATLNGVKLEPGSYKLELNEMNQAVIYRHGKEVTRARVQVKPRPDHIKRGSLLLTADRTIREIRVGPHVVVFER